MMLQNGRVHKYSVQFGQQTRIGAAIFCSLDAIFMPNWGHISPTKCYVDLLAVVNKNSSFEVLAASTNLDVAIREINCRPRLAKRHSTTRCVQHHDDNSPVRFRLACCFGLGFAVLLLTDCRLGCGFCDTITTHNKTRLAARIGRIARLIYSRGLQVYEKCQTRIIITRRNFVANPKSGIMFPEREQIAMMAT